MNKFRVDEAMKFYRDSGISVADAVIRLGEHRARVEEHTAQTGRITYRVFDFGGQRLSTNTDKARAIFQALSKLERPIKHRAYKSRDTRLSRALSLLVKTHGENVSIYVNGEPWKTGASIILALMQIDRGIPNGTAMRRLPDTSRVRGHRALSQMPGNPSPQEPRSETGEEPDDT